MWNHARLQNYALVYEPARLEDNVFIGPAAVLTNDVYPRSVDVSGNLKRPADWDALGVVVKEGASLGARVVVAAGRSVGRSGQDSRLERAEGSAEGRRGAPGEDGPEDGLVAGQPQDGKASDERDRPHDVI